MSYAHHLLALIEDLRYVFALSTGRRCSDYCRISEYPATELRLLTRRYQTQVHVSKCTRMVLQLYTLPKCGPLRRNVSPPQPCYGGGGLARRELCNRD